MSEPRPALDPAALLGAMRAFRDRMREHEDEINGLNVFPVPDGDTGTNVLLTVEAALAAVAAPADLRAGPAAARPTTPAPAQPTTPAAAQPLDRTRLCDQLGRGMILGARGSSGVILSQAVAAALAVVAASAEPPAETLAEALERARAAAYSAVAAPVEGTILTVLTAAAAAADEAVDLPLPDLVELVALEARSAVARTPVLLPVLARAGVVDSGGRALSLGLDAFAEMVGGRRLPPQALLGPALLGPALLTSTGADEQAQPSGEAPGGSGRFEVVATLRTDDAGATRLRERWRVVGDAVVVAGVADTWRAHVHTDDPDAAVAVGREVTGADGLNDVHVTDLYAQVEARAAQTSGHHPGPARTGPAGTGAATTATEAAGVALVAVVEGAGLDAAFADLGAVVVDPGMPAPSVQDLVGAIERCPATDVLLLPNDSNVQPAAAQARALSTKRVHVIPTRNQLAGLAATVVFDAGATPAANVRVMTAAIERTRGGRVASVVRDSVVAIGPVRRGQWLALADRVAVAAGETAVETALGLAEHLLTPRTEVFTIVWGTAATAEQAQELAQRLRSRPSPAGTEPIVELFYGGHRDAFLLSAEDDPHEEESRS